MPATIPTMPPAGFVSAMDDQFIEVFFEVRPEAADNILTSNVISALLRDKGCMEAQTGGKNIERTIRYATGSATQDVWKGDVLGMGEPALEMPAFWRFERATATHVQRDLFDDVTNAGKFKNKSYITKRLEAAMDVLKLQYEASFLHTHVAAETGKAPQGLGDLVPPPATRATGTWGGIARPTTYSSTNPNGTDAATVGNTWYAPVYRAMSGDPDITLLSDMRTMYNNVTAQMEPPDVILTSQTLYETFEDFGLEAIQVALNEKMLDFGFNVLRWNGAQLTWAPGMGSTGTTLTDGTASAYAGLTYAMLFLNTRRLQVIYNPLLYFHMTEWQTIPRQTTRLAYILCQQTMISDQPRRHGLLYTT